MTQAGDRSHDRPAVSVVIPCRNERAHIAACLDSITQTEYPSDRLEVLVVDGASDDGSRDVIAEYARREPRVRLLDNPKRITPTALNIGIRAARGAVIIRMDAHCHYPPDYLAKLVTWLMESGADNVGGVCRTVPASDTPIARGVALALAHPFAVGNAHFRIGVREPRWVDTVPFGCYRRSVFETIGFFDEDLVRNQDDEFNHRLVRHGGRILLVPDVQVDYYARETIGKLARMYYQYGLFKPLVIKKLRSVLTLRQLAPPLFVSVLGVTAVLAPVNHWAVRVFLATALTYLTVAALMAFLGARSRASLGARLALFLAFPAVHLSYGLGFCTGVWKFWIRGRHGLDRSDPVPLSR